MLPLSFQAGVVGQSRLSAPSLFLQQVLFTLQVEDLTGKGQQDLADGIVRTPLPAHETFQDGAVLTVAPLQPCWSLTVACLAFEPQSPWFLQLTD